MKKWKSLFACGLVLLLTGWTMLCIPFNAYVQKCVVLLQYSHSDEPNIQS